MQLIKSGSDIPGVVNLDHVDYCTSLNADEGSAMIYIAEHGLPHAEPVRSICLRICQEV